MVAFLAIRWRFFTTALRQPPIAAGPGPVFRRVAGGGSGVRQHGATSFSWFDVGGEPRSHWATGPTFRDHVRDPSGSPFRDQKFTKEKKKWEEKTRGGR